MFETDDIEASGRWRRLLRTFGLTVQSHKNYARIKQTGPKRQRAFCLSTALEREPKSLNSFMPTRPNTHMDFAYSALSVLILIIIFTGMQWAEALDSPLKQMQAGIKPGDIICLDKHVLAIRATQDPMCVTPRTADVMLERGIIVTIIGRTMADSNDQHLEPHTSNDIIVDDMVANVKGNRTDNSGEYVDMTDGAGFESHEPPIAVTDTVLEDGAVDDGEDRRVADDDGDKDMTQTGRPVEIRTIPASAMSVVNFYVTDDDLNIAHNAVEIVPTDRLLFMINDMPIQGPATMTETGPNTGQFYVRLELPATIDGRPLSQSDVVHITYLDQTDHSGEARTVTGSFALASTYAQIQSDGDGSRIGHEFTLRIYEPDANLDSRDENKIPLSSLEFRSEGGIRAPLSNHVFDANRSHMVETGPNTGIFEVEIKIPRQIDGKIIHIGDWYEITYLDATTPSGSAEEIVLRGKIGR